MWQEPIFDRTNADTLTARAGQSNIDNHKGALNYQDLNRIEGNYQYLLEHLETDAIFIPHAYRNLEETTIELVDVTTEYTPVEYIESSGTQHIDTVFVCNGNSKIEAEFEVLNAENNSAYLYGGGSGGARIEAYPWNYTMEMNYGTQAPFIGSLVANKKFYICQDKGNFHLSYTDGSGSWTQKGETQTFDCAVSMAIFVLNRESIYYPVGGMRLYWFKIYDNDVLARDFIPVKDKNGVACLYDKVSQAYFYNAGTGTFTAGAELPKETTKEIIEVKRKYTDWQEQNVPWLSEVDRIRQNFNNLIALFLRTLDLPMFPSNIYLMYSEVNDWERVSLVGKTMFENMEKEYVYSGTIDCGGDRLL